MAVHKYSAAGAAQTLLTTELDGLTNGSCSAASAAVTNSSAGNRHLFCTIELVVTFGTAPTAGKTVDIYFLPTIDGTNYADGSSSVTPGANSYAGAVAVRNVNTAQRLILTGVVMPPHDFKVIIINNAGQAFSASGHTLKISTYSWETP